MRCFVAIDIDEGIKKAIGDLQDSIIASVSGSDIKKSDIKWVSPEQMHLTLKFLGEIRDKEVVELCSIVESVAARHTSFELDIGSVGYFGGGSARVLWVGTGEGGESLCRLQEDIDNQLASAGQPKDSRKFSGHLTLCRVRRPAAGVKLVGVSEDYRDFKAGTMTADAVAVYQSQLTPRGPVYTVLGNYKLQ